MRKSFEIIEVSTITKFVKIINERLNNSNKNYYYRGENEKFEFRTPSLYLEDSLAFLGSEFYYRTLIKEMGEEIATDSATLTRQLAEMQHYGAKTRILDITTNPLIALYFAVDIDNGKDGYIYIYQEEKREEKFDTGHTIAIKTALNFVSTKVINDFIGYYEKYGKLVKLFGENIDSEKNFKSFKDSLAFTTSLKNLLEKGNKYTNDTSNPEMFIVEGDSVHYHKMHFDRYNLLKNERKLFLLDFNRDISSEKVDEFLEILNQRALVKERLQYSYEVYKDLTISHIVLATKATDRIRQQQGAFIFPCYVNTDGKSHEEIKKDINKSIEDKAAPFIIKVSSENKKKLRKELTKFGISKGIIYPDIQHKSQDILDILREDFVNKNI